MNSDLNLQSLSHDDDNLAGKSRWPESGQRPSPVTHTPSVPISVYRELAAELQTAQTEIEALKFQNQQLLEQNHLFRQQTDQVAQATRRLQAIAERSNNPRAYVPPLPRSSAPHPERQKETPPPQAEAPDYSLPHSYTEQPESEFQDFQSGDRSVELKGWWLILTITLIVITAFGTGFLIARPFLANPK